MRVKIFQALRHRSFLLFCTGSFFSFSGQWVQVMALSWLVLELTNSPFYLGLIGLVRAIPALVFSLLGGVLADRINRRWLFFFTHLGVLSMSLLLALLITLGMANIWIVFGVTFLGAIVFAMNNTTRQALIPQLVEKPELVNAIALNQAAFSAGRMVGPIIAGAIIALWDIAACFYFNAMIMIPLALALLSIRVPNPVSTTRTSNIYGEFVEGLRYVRRNREIASLLFLVAFPTFFGMSYTVLLPIYARDLLGVGASGYGALMSASAVGGLIAAFIVANLGTFNRKGLLILWVAILFGLLLVIFALSNWYLLSLVLVALIGAANNGYLTLTNSLIQLLVPEKIRGRVMSLYMLNPAVLHHLGTLFLGAVATVIGATFSLIAGGFIVAGFVSYMAIKVPQLRRL